MRPRPSSRSVNSILEEQVQRWTLHRAERPPVAQAVVDHWPIVTVSREFGSLGAATGRLVAQKLGFVFWDQEILQAIAEQTGAQETLLASLDERSRSGVEEFVAHLIFGTNATTAEYVRQVARVVRTLDRQGECVVVGRGAQFILEPERVLRVRVVGPFAARVEGYAKREGLSAREAEREVRSVDEERRAFIRQHYDKDIAEPSHYDLLVNAASLKPEPAARVIVAAYESKFGRLPKAAA